MPPGDDAVSIGVVGAGRIGRRHIELIGGSSGSRLAAVVDPDPSAVALAEEAGVPWFATLEALLAGRRPDAVILATPNPLHMSQALACLSARVAVLVEKPIATTVDDGLRMADAADTQGVPLLVGHHRRHSPLLSVARELIRDGRLGQVVAASAVAMFVKPEAYFTSAWRRESGGGPVLINLIHDVDALRMLLGDIVSVQATASRAVRGRPVEETVAATFRLASGGLGSILLSDAAASATSWESTAGEDPAFATYPDRDCYEIAGTRGTLGIPTLRLLSAEGSPSWEQPMRLSVHRPPRADPLARQLEHFIEVVRGRHAPLVSGRDATESLRVALAIAEAAATGVEVACAPPGPPASEGP